MKIVDLTRMPFEDFRERFLPLAESEAFSAYASGDGSLSVVVALCQELRRQGIPEELWQSDGQLEMLTKLITGRLVARK